nr:MAG TPA: hypothetical protein [Caudoviricetes sp.]
MVEQLQKIIRLSVLISQSSTSSLMQKFSILQETSERKSFSRKSRRTP